MCSSEKLQDVQSAERQQRKNLALPPKFTEFLEGLVDTSDRREGGDVILWLNDLEKDVGFRPSLMGVQSQFRLIVQPLLIILVLRSSSVCILWRFSLAVQLFILNLSQLRSLSVISHLHDNFVMRRYPVRWSR